MKRGPLDVALPALLAATAGLAFHRVFPLAAIATPVVLSATLPAALTAAIAAVVRHRGRAVIACTSVGLLVGMVTLIESTFPATTSGGLPTPTSFAVVADGVVNGWLRILSVPAPARPVPGMLVVVPLLTWLAAQAGAALAVWSDRPLRPAIPSALALLLAVAAGVGGRGSSLPLTAAYAALIALLLVLRGGSGHRAEQAGGAPSRPARHLAGALAAVLAGALACLLVGPHLPWAQARKPFDPRQLVDPPRRVESGMNPLDQIAGWAAQPDLPLFTVRSSNPDNLRLAVLDRFDGTRWTASDRYGDLPARIPGETELTVPTAMVTTSVTLHALPGSWLPAPDRPAVVSGLDARVATGSAVLMRPPGNGGPLTYLVESRVPRHTATALATAMPAPDDAARQLAEGLPQQLAQDARRATAEGVTPFQQMALLERWLRGHHRFSRAAAPGHSYASLAYFLRTSKRGTSEHFAAAFAVMARSLGFASRVVVGFSPHRHARPGQSFVVRSGDALAWPEVGFSGLGWVPFYPTPSAPEGQAPRPGSLARGQSPARAAVDEKAALTKFAPKVDQPTDRPPQPSGHRLPWRQAAAVAAIAVAVLLVVLLGAAVRVRSRTRRRRTTANSSSRVLGAWQEAVEHVAVLTQRMSSAMTAEEVAGSPAGRLPDDSAVRLWALAGMFNEATFAARAVTSEQADAAWRHADEVTRVVRALLPWQRRLRLVFGRAAFASEDPEEAGTWSVGVRRRLGELRTADARRG